MSGELVPEIYLTKDEFALLTKLLESFEPEYERERTTRDKLLEKIRRKTEIPVRVRPIVETVECIPGPARIHRRSFCSCLEGD